MDISNDLGKRVELLEKNSHVPYDFTELIKAVDTMCECMQNIAISIPASHIDVRRHIHNQYRKMSVIRRNIKSGKI